MFYGDNVWDDGDNISAVLFTCDDYRVQVTLSYKGDPIHGNISKTRREISVTGQRHKMKST